MDEKELKELKRLALNYSDPIRGKILAAIACVEILQEEQKQLKEDSEVLSCLKACGVEKLQCWENAMDMFNDVE
jgi:hypothetical protein